MSDILLVEKLYLRCSFFSVALLELLFSSLSLAAPEAITHNSLLSRFTLLLKILLRFSTFNLLLR